MEKLKYSAIIRFIINFAGKIQLKKLNKVSKNCKKAQAKTLRQILNYAKDTEWGKKHNYSSILNSKNPDELFENWQKNVPPVKYEDIKEFIERHKKGEKNILFPGKPMLYAVTSGSIDEVKWIPVTEAYYENVYSQMSKMWIYTFLVYRPRIFEGKSIAVVGNPVRGVASDGTPCGSISGIVRRDCPKIVKSIYSEIADVYTISDYKTRYYIIMRVGLEQNICILVTANPYTIVEMQDSVNEFFDDYITDIERGTLNKSLNIDPEIREKVEADLKPNPQRAAELRALKEKYGTLLPKHYWPNLQVLTTWKCGNSPIYIDKFKDSFPKGIHYQDFGFFSSECRAGLVMNGGNDTVLFPHMHFFEFVDYEESSSKNPRFYQLHEIELGKKYIIYVTTWAGLYRYCMDDLIEVTGFYNSIPTIRFVEKLSGIISMSGEKLHEYQFIKAVREAETSLNIEIKFFTGFAEVEDFTYHFYFEFVNENVSQETADNLSKVIDENLKRDNCNYKAKRDSLIIKAPVAHILQKKSFETFKIRSIDKGARDGQFKLNILMKDEKRHRMFRELVKR